MTSNDLVPAKCVIWHQRPCAGVGSPPVLVVDDYVDTADAIGMILMLEGFSTEVAYRSQTAIEIAHRWQPDIVVLDICMPDLSGFEVAMRLRNQESTEAVIIMDIRVRREVA